MLLVSGSSPFSSWYGCEDAGSTIVSPESESAWATASRSVGHCPLLHRAGFPTASSAVVVTVQLLAARAGPALPSSARTAIAATAAPRVLLDPTNRTAPSVSTWTSPLYATPWFAGSSIIPGASVDVIVV